ncbi:MAG: hypothetical protein DSY90_01705, partial [Deltaproteobacteria bacterium]
MALHQPQDREGMPLVFANLMTMVPKDKHLVFSRQTILLHCLQCLMFNRKSTGSGSSLQWPGLPGWVAADPEGYVRSVV